MAGYLLPVPDITQSVVRPVVIQVCRALQTHLNLGRDLDLVYAGDTLAIPQSGTNLSDKSDLPLLAGKEKLYVDFKEVPRRDSVFKIQPAQPQTH